MKKLLAFILACLMLVPAFAGCAEAPEATVADGVIASDGEGLVKLNAEEKAKEITVYPTEKAYTRNGNDWKSLNWREIIKMRGINQNNAEPLVIKEGGNSYTRYVYFTFDISKFNSIPYYSVFLKPSFTTVNAAGLTYNVYKVNSKQWNSDTITWDNQPTRGGLVAENAVAGALFGIDVTDAVDAAIKAGETEFSVVLVPNKQGSDGENHIDWRTTTLTATTSKTQSSYVKNLVEDEAENQAIWDWAQQIYDEWYPRYEYLVKTGIPDVELIPIDENEYSKTVITTGSGMTSYDRVTLETKKWTEADFKKKEPTRTIDTLIGLGDYSDFDKEQKFDIYGGLIDETVRQEPTGFFYTTKIGDRWWVIDPLGYPCYIRALSGVGINYLNSPNQKEAALEKYGTSEKWGIAATRQIKDDWCFNASTSNGTEIKNVINRLIYQSSCGFVGSYGTHIGTNSSKGGNTTFEGNNTMNVFDPAFVDWCDEKAKSVEARKDDKWLLGYTMDNELPIDKNMLFNYLRLSPADPTYHYSYAAAWTWLVNFTGKENPTDTDITDEMLKIFVGFVYDRFYYLGSSAIRKYDPNHMVLGSRMLTGFMNHPWVFRFAGLHLDCLTINWYGEWDIPVEDLKFVSENSNLPFMITEFYTKGMDSGLDNTRGAGWVVKTQQDRGDFYQCYTLRLLECKNLIGWHWFQYIDNDPDPAVIYTTKDGVKVWRDQSSVDANKGIVDNSHNPYTDLVNSMAEINKNVYKLIEHFDAKYAQD